MNRQNRQSKLLGWMREHEKTQSDLAEILGLSRATISQKLNGGIDLKLTECKKICEEWDLTMDIFE